MTAARVIATRFIVIVAILGSGGCGHGTQPQSKGNKAQRRQGIAGVLFVSTPRAVRRACSKTADKVGYSVPCPTTLPEGLAPTPAVHGCHFAVVGTDAPECGGREWRGWIVGSVQGESTGGFQHLATLGAPRVVRDPARAIDGPAMFPGSRVRPEGVTTIGGRTMHWYFVPPASNIGSIFAHHLVLVWTRSGHTYAYGFHVVTTFAEARALDLELMRHLVIVTPRRIHS